MPTLLHDGGAMFGPIFEQNNIYVANSSTQYNFPQAHNKTIIDKYLDKRSLWHNSDTSFSMMRQNN